MKNTIILLTLVLATNLYAFDFKKFFKEDLKYNAFAGAGIVDIKEDNSFDSDLKFNFVNFGGGMSYQLTEKYKLSANIALKKFTKLKYSQSNKSGSTSVNSTYSDLFFAVSRNWKDFVMTVGYDNLNYFIGAKEDLIEPVRVDRASIKAAWLKYQEKKIIPSAKFGIFIPVSDDVSGFDLSLVGKYIVTEDKKFSVDVYLYKAFLSANSNTSDALSYGLSAAYEF